MNLTATRGCGGLAHDSVYLRCELGEKGIPLWRLPICPVWPLDHKAMRISDNGFNFLPRVGPDGEVLEVDGRPVFDIYDVVGVTHYQYKADFWVETTHLGTNRKFNPSDPLDLLHPGISRHILCTHHGWLTQPSQERVMNAANEDEMACIRRKHPIPLYTDFDGTCTSMWFHEIHESDASYDGSKWMRDIPTGPYQVYPDSQKMDWGFGAFMLLPIGNLLVTTPRGEQDNSTRTQRAIDLAQALNMTVQVVSLPDDL